MRGTEGWLPPNHEMIRFIPAHAGNGVVGRGSGSFRAVHPRACGERSGRHRFSSSVSGSSPRMRGTAQVQGPVVPQLRFIPAHAGNGMDGVRVPFESSGSSPRMRGTALRSALNGRFFPVHPRACGERSQTSARLHLAVRFIPAHAGNGVKAFVESLPDAGSSPRMRGTGVLDSVTPDRPSVHPRACGERHCPRHRRDSRVRFIPAHAGNGGDRKDYCLIKPGSSPRMRGTEPAFLNLNRVIRFIPAHAGNGRGFSAE